MCPEKYAVRQEANSALRFRQGRFALATILSPLRNYALGLTLLGLLFTIRAHGQTARFSASQTTVPSSSLNYPYRVAVDSANNVYISDTQNHRVLRETWSSDGSYTESGVASVGLNTPYGVAVDSSGNVYIADNGNARILKETPSAGGYVETQLTTSSLNYPTGVAVDPLGNIYIVDTGHGRVLKETPSSGSYIETVISSSGLPQAVGIAVDSSGNIFLTDINTMQVIMETPSGGSYTQSIVATSGLNYPYDIAVDANDNLYISDFANNRIVKETLSGGVYTQSVLPTYALRGGLGLALDFSGNLYLADTFGFAIWKLSATGADFGPVNVGSQSGVGYLLYCFAGGAGGTLNLSGTAILTQGAAGLDYSDSRSGNCSTSTSYAAGDTCAIGVYFKPQYPGERLGAAQLLASGNTILATGFASGSGVAPQINFLPGLESVVASSAGMNPQGVAVDASGNIFIADGLNDVVLKINPAGAQSTVANSSGGMAGPADLAVDGSGAVYIADPVNNQILKQTPSPNGYTQTVVANAAINGLNAAYGVAVDGNGNAYIADTRNNRILLETLSSSVYSQIVIPTSGLNLPHGIAVDLRGNIYIADYGNNRVVMETFAGGTYTQSTIGSGLNGPTGVYVDANCNVYIADYNDNRIVKETVSGGGYIQSQIFTSALANPFGVALDGSGNVYISDVGNKRVLKEDFADPPALTFAATNVGSTSTDSPKAATLFNFGNATLAIAVPASGNNPSLSTNSFSIDSASTCPQVSSAGSAGTIAANISCSYAVDFSPAQAGPNNDALVLTDDNLNKISATQAIPLSGSGIVTFRATTITLNANPVSPISFGRSLTLTATLNPFSASGQTTDGESVAFKNGATTLGTGTLNSGVATLSLPSLSAGTYTFTAVYAGDTNFGSSTSSAINFVVSKAVPAITWATPAAIAFGSALSATQLDATTTVAGTFVYSPASGTIPAAGVVTLSVTFTPTDTTDYTNATSTTAISVYDFTISSPGGSSTQKIQPGAAATFPLAVSPVGSAKILNAITFSVSGLPTGAIGTFTPASLSAGSAATIVNLVVQTSSSGSIFLGKPLYGAPISNLPVALTLFSLTLLALLPLRKRLQWAFPRLGAVLFMILILAAGAGLTGCLGISAPGGPGSGSTTQLMVTATSGTIQHSVNLTLVVHK